jgi:transposase InsO family protein
MLNRWEQEQKSICELSRAIHSVRPSFGYRRTAHRILEDTGWKVSGKRVLKCMQHLGIQARVRRKRVYGVGRENGSYPNLLARDFKTNRPLEKVAVDVTYLYSRGTVQYLSVFLDLFNNEILEYEISSRNDLELVIAPLKRLLHANRRKITKQSIFHSDQGIQFLSKSYHRYLEKYGIRLSMSRKGTPLDNAPIESFFGWFKDEVYSDYRPRSPGELAEAVRQHAHFYNHLRPQKRLNYKAPIPYRNERLAMI